MGRPKKRQRPGELEKLYDNDDEIAHLGDEFANFDPDLSAILSSNERYVDPDSLPADPKHLLSNGVICPPPLSSYMRKNDVMAASQLHLYSVASFGEELGHDTVMGLSTDDTPPSDSPLTPPSLHRSHRNPQNESLGPEKWNIDFSNFALPTMLNSTSNPSPSTSATVPTLPAVCPCLPNLYLTLSMLSTLTAQNPASIAAPPGSSASASSQSSFPLSSPATLTTLRTASRTAYSVLHCSICPRNFQSGMQNVMLLCTLLSVLGDLWGRLASAPTSDVRENFLGYSGTRDNWSDDEWASWTRAVVKKGIYGIPKVDEDTASSGLVECPIQKGESFYPLTYLINSMERRQKTWHGEGESEGEEEFPGHMESAQQGRKIMTSCKPNPYPGIVGINPPEQSHDKEKEYEQEHLCVKIVDNIRQIIEQLNLDE